MIGKLIIFGVIAAVAAIFLIPEVSTIIPNFLSLEAISEKGTTDSGKDTTLDVINSQNEIQPLDLDLDLKYVNKQFYTGQVFEKSDEKCKVSVPGLAETVNGKKELTHILDVKDCPYEVNEPVKITKLDAKDDIPIPVISTSSIIIDPYSTPEYVGIIQLTSTHKGSDVMLNYNDALGNTIGVVVTLKNSDREIFSGQFTSSKFETLVNDVPNTPHMIEMTIEHSVYGTLHASVYAPADAQDSIISGVFTESN